jgi:hemin uptake protein HemP
VPETPEKSTAVAADDSAESPETTRVIRSEDLLQGRIEVQILHDSQLYRLRRTKNGKLILQK